jgi:RHS repeat-associated protein
VAVAQAQTVVEYIHTDALGTPVAVTNSAGAVIERSVYEPYGQLINRALTDGPGFTGHVQDAATGLTYMQQRYYDPQVGVFLSVDSVTAYDSPNLQFHRYRYANSNPFGFIDPDGRKPDRRSLCERTPLRCRAVIPVAQSDKPKQVARNGRDNGLPVRPGNEMERFSAASREVDGMRSSLESVPHDSRSDAVNTFNAMLQPIVTKYGLEIEAAIGSSVEAYKIYGITVGDQFDKRGIGFTVKSPFDGNSTIHGHPLATSDNPHYAPFSRGDTHWYGASPGVPHFVTNPNGSYQYDGAGKPVIRIDK